MTDTFRAMCAELVELSAPVDSVSRLAWRLQQLDRLANRARALLDQPVAEGPTDEELAASRHPTPAAEGEVAEVAAWLRLFCSEEYESRSFDPDVAWLTRAAELLERPTPQPVAEGPTIPSHYRGHGIAVYRDGFHAGYKEALARSANALPTPEATNE